MLIGSIVNVAAILAGSTVGLLLRWGIRRFSALFSAGSGQLGERLQSIRSAECWSGGCFLRTNTLKNCVAKQRISLGSVQNPIDNKLITLPCWDGY